MKPPRRLLEGPLTTAERRALTAGLSLAAPAASKERIWAGIGTGLGAGVTLTTATAAAAGGNSTLAATSQLASPAATALAGGAAAGWGAVAAGAAAKTAPLWPMLVKTLVTWTLIGSGVGVAAKIALHEPATGTTSAVRVPVPSTASAHDGRSSVPRAADRRLAAPDSSPPDTVPFPRELSQPATRAVATSRPAVSAAALPPRTTPGTADATGDHGTRRAPSLALERESQWVAQAWARLRAGQPGKCLALLARVDTHFPRGALQQERRALAIEAHAALGQQAQVRELARDFVNEYPESPYASKISEMARP